MKIDRIAKNLNRGGYLFMTADSASRECHHFLFYFLHTDLSMCCGCGHTVPSSYQGAILREAFE